MELREKKIHKRNCCKDHCKYNEPDCPCVLGTETPLYRCTHKGEQFDDSPELGLKEQLILADTVSIISNFQKLEQTHPEDYNLIAESVNQIQSIIALRLARRTLPEHFPIKEDSK